MHLPGLRELTAAVALGALLVAAPGCGRRLDPRVQEGYDLVVAGKTDEAIALANALLTENPKSAPARNLVGLALYKKGDMEGAVEQYHRALDLDPRYPEAHFNLGNAYERLRRLKDAESCYLEAIRHQRKFVLAHYNLAHLYSLTDRRGEAMAEIRICLEHDPQFLLGYVLLGRLAYDAGDFETAVANLGRARELDPLTKELRVLLGNAYLQSGDERAVPAAETEFRAAVGIDSSYVDAVYSLGMTLALQEKSEEAAPWFRRARALAADQPDKAAMLKVVDDFFARTGLPAGSDAPADSPG